MRLQSDTAPMSPVERARADLMKKYIMLVDDEAGVLALVSIILQRGGFGVHTARDARAALNLLETYQPDLFILDVMMPGIDGLELCRRLRADQRTASTPVIICSARCDDNGAQMAADAGADAFIPKLTVHRELLPRVRGMLEQGNNITA